MMNGSQPIARRTRRQIDLFCITEIARRKKHKRNSTATLSKDSYDDVVVLDFDVNDLNVEIKGNDNYDEDFTNFTKVMEAEVEAVKGGGREEGFINRKSSSGSYDREVEEVEERHFGSFNLRRDSNLQRKKLEQEKIEIIDDSDINDGDDKEEKSGDREGGFVKRKCSSRSCFDGKGAEKGEKQFYSVNLRRDSGLQRNTLEQRTIENIDIDGCNINVSDDNEDDGDNVSGGGYDGDSDASNGNDDDDGNSDDTDSDGGDDNADSVDGHAADNDAVLQYDIRTGTIDGSNSYDFGTNGRGLLAVDSSYTLKEMERGLSGGLKNQKGVFPITSAIKVQNISSNVYNENTCTDPERKQYNGEEFPVKYTGAKFFIINVFSKENLHKSIKYSLWASTPDGNKKLDVGYLEAQKKAGYCPVFLFFFSVSTGQFVGLAEMVGPVEYGFFRVKWHIIKDIHTSLLKHTLENNDNKLVTESQDIQEVALMNGLQMLKVFKDHACKTCILNDCEGCKK